MPPNFAPATPDANILIATLAEQIRGLPAATVIVGIHTGGVWVAERLAHARGGSLPIGKLAVTLHRDDFGAIGLHHQKRATDIAFNVEGAHILLVDDVIQSGRTVRAALNELYDFGRPASVKLACLVDRGGRELPFAADFSALTLALPDEQKLALIETMVNGVATLAFSLNEKTNLKK